MNRTLGIALAALALPFGAAACSGSTTATEDAGNGDKAALEAAAALLAQPVALISAYQPHLQETDGKDPYAPKRRSDLEKAATAAAGEIRFAANGARQKLKSSPATKELEAALGEISKACTDAADSEAFGKCDGSVKALDAALAKAATAATAAGVTAKIPRVAPETVNDEARKAIAPFLKGLLPGPAEKEYFAKRSDPKAAAGDVIAACQSASDEASKVMAAYEHVDEPLRLIAVTHKLSLDSQLNALNGTAKLQQDLADCRKKAKSTECKVTCSKVRTRIDEGLPAAVFGTMAADADAICEK